MRNQSEARATDAAIDNGTGREALKFNSLPILAHVKTI